MVGATIQWWKEQGKRTRGLVGEFCKANEEDQRQTTQLPGNLERAKTARARSGGVVPREEDEMA